MNSDGKMLRLFVALEVDESLRGQILSLPRKGLDSARWSHPDDLHITLRFIGDVKEGQADKIKDILQGLRVQKFSIVVRGLNVFRKKHQSILYAPVESARKVTHLSAEITERLQTTGLEFPIQEYTPHVTIARLKKFQGLPDYIDHHSKKIHAEWRAEKFSLYLSANPDEGGKRYTQLAQYPLPDY